MTLYNELNDLVSNGTTTWEEIISEIIKVKTETKLSYYQVISKRFGWEDRRTKKAIRELKEYARQLDYYS